MLWFFLLLLLVSFGLVSRADALGTDFSISFRYEISLIVNENPKYLWGGATSEKQGLDCSGVLALAAKRAGGTQRRTTAYRMSLGEAGWDGYAVKVNKRKDLDLVWWTLKEKRPYGHVGIFWGSSSVVHASSSKGVIIESFAGWLVSKMVLVRRLTFGE